MGAGAEMTILISPKTLDLQGLMAFSHYILSLNPAVRLKVTVLFPITQKPRVVVLICVLIAPNKFFIKFITTRSLEDFLRASHSFF